MSTKMTEPFGSTRVSRVESMADDHAAAAPATESRAVAAAPVGHGVPVPAAGAGFPAHPRPGAGAPAVQPTPKRSRGLRRFIVPIVLLAGLGYGGKMAYDYFVVGRFLVSTDDAYVGASTAIIAAKATGHLTQVPVVDNQVVHQGDLLALIDDGDYRNAVDAAQARIDTQDATIARFGRQIDAQAAVISQAEAQVEASKAQLKGAEADAERAALEYGRSLKLEQSNFGSQQRLEQATADRGEGERRFDGGCGGRRQGQSRRPEGAARRGDAPAGGTRDGARQGQPR